MRIVTIMTALLLAVGCAEKKEAITTASKDAKQPNVLIIYPDQLRRYSAGFWSKEEYRKYVIGKPDPVITPNIDQLAENGVVFTQAVSNFPLCSPARGMILSGRYPEQNGIWNNCRKDRSESLRDDIPTITDLFYEAGYNTSYFGKCHWLKNEALFDENGTYVGSTEEPGGHYINRYDTYVPPGKSRHSIEYFYQSIRDTHYDPLVYSNDPNTVAGKKDGELHQPKTFTPKNEAEKIKAYLENKHKVRDSDKPFFMMWSINPPHNPWDDENTDMETLAKYYNTDKFPQDSLLAVRENADLKVASYVRHYFANLTSVDHYIGEVMETLREMGELDNTIIIFSSDHGEMLGSHGKEGKNVFETEALAIPFIVHWPKGIKAGGINDVLFSVPDVLPTVMGLAGMGQKIPEAVQGYDFSPLIIPSSDTSIEKPKGVLLMLTKSRGILTDRYTLCVEQKADRRNRTPDDKDIYLYDNLKDPYQLKRLGLDERPQEAAALLQLLGSELKRTNDPWYQQKKFKDVIRYE
ncbi:sulfatase [Zobellia galactanivorans]|uniref:sulfatase family protein n=1 Tax=Zobellia galactanivorans (strain DSM 12802 / CCUG 47099 / CIP 106680 / NCIMB 13871 / Dsij) TaxID=63186 RepID=UPI0026E39E74|nr:sulfatase [Zobellia galactanivorans]MDO6807556.1 sulfatase [Zobellia galactanivorans]